MRRTHFIAAAALLLALGGARAEIVLIGHPSAAPLSKELAAEVFLGKVTTLTPVDQAESAPIRSAFYKQLTSRTLAQVKATWSRLVFAGNGQLPKELADAAAVKKAVAADPKAVGYIDRAAVDGSVKVLLSLD